MKKEFIFRIFSDIPQLETDRLILRKMLVSDSYDMYEYSQRADVTKYLTWQPHPGRGYTKNYLEYVSTRYESGDFFDWAVVEKASGRMIGTCGFTRFNLPSDSAEIGYVINPDFSGRGYATEAVRRVIDFGFNVLGLNRIEAKYMEGNKASHRVMEKVGMTYEGMHRSSMLVFGAYKNIGICSILKNEW